MSPTPIDERLVWLCRAAVKVTGVTSCGVTMVTRSGQSITAHATDHQARSVEDLQHTLGEGPGVAASESGAAVMVPDLGDRRDRTLERWPTFVGEVVGLGIRAAFAFPLLLGTSRIGALTFYRVEPGALSTEEISRGWVSADAVALTLAEQGEALPSGVGELDPMSVHQAAGMVMVQLGVPIDQALMRMRATAFAEGRTVDELAEAIVRRRRRLSEEDR